MLVRPGALLTKRAPTTGASAPVYATWIDLVNLIAENNGVARTAATADDSVGVTSESFTDGGGIQWTYDWTVDSFSSTIYLMVDGADPLVGFPNNVNIQFGMQLLNTNRVKFYWRSNLRFDITDAVAGETFALREQDGAIEGLRNGAVVYTYPEAPHATMQGRASIVIQNTAMPNIELLGGVWS